MKICYSLPHFFFLQHPFTAQGIRYRCTSPRTSCFMHARELLFCSHECGNSMKEFPGHDLLGETSTEHTANGWSSGRMANEDVQHEKVKCV
uniref:Secreted protein n=1 Tax=Steinernema glaseri TaxID=37863 RepID=A0A1I7YI14_9BILA